MSTPATAQRAHFGHPPGLFVLFFSEMWERMSYYGMRSLLTLYMVEYLFLKPDVGPRMLGLDAVRSTLEGVFGPLAVRPRDHRAPVPGCREVAPFRQG